MTNEAGAQRAEPLSAAPPGASRRSRCVCSGSKILLKREVVGTPFGRRAWRGNRTLWAVVIVRVLELHRCGFATRDRHLLKHRGQRIGFKYGEISAFLALPRPPAEQ